MTIINVIEDSTNPSKYLVISTQGATSESVLNTNVVVSSANRINLIEVSKIQGDKGEPGIKGDQGLPGKDGVIFDILSIGSGGTNNNSFINNKVIYYDGTKLSSSNIDVNSIQTDIISNINPGSGLRKTQDGQSVTINASLGNGLTLDAYNQISIEDTIITQYNFDLSEDYVTGKLSIPHGGTNNTFFSDDKFIFYDGEKLASFPLSTGSIVYSGQKISVLAGSGLVGGGEVTIPNGSIVIGLQNSDDILVTNDSVELSTIVSSGVYSKVVVDAKGRVRSGSQITLNDLISYLGFTPWYSGNDGAGSNLDADLLDAQHGSYYRNASNITGILSTDVLPNTIEAGSAAKVTFNSKGLIIDSGILSYLDITQGLGYVPFDKNGGQILGNVELFGSLIADSGSFESNAISIGSYDSTSDLRGIRFRYGDYPQKTAILGYFPSTDTFRIFTESQDGKIITEERADTKYVGITGYQEISGIKAFLDSISVYGRVIIRSKYDSLPPIDIGTNNLLVLNLNSDLLDGQHGLYYRNAANLTGILNQYVVLPHLEDRSTVEYDSGGGFLEYIPKFHRPSSGHPVVLKDSLIYETGVSIYMDQANLSVGYNKINPASTHTTLIGTNNSGSAIALNSLAVGENNIVSGTNSFAIGKNNTTLTNNSITLVRNAESWIDDQIVVGGFANNTVGTNGKSERDSHGQLSYIPLKYHGQASSWTNILNFNLPDNKTIEYSAELLFTKQKETGVASFSISTGIIKNYGYRDPARNYEAYKKTIKVIDHRVSELYNNSQERTYSLNIIGTSDIDQEINQSTLKVTAPPLQYEPLNIENYSDPIIVEPVSDHQTRLKAVRGDSSLGAAYRSDYVIKLSPFDSYPYNSGARINLGRNISHITECLFYRESGSPSGYIKFYNHGISPNYPLSKTVYVGTTGSILKILSAKENNFNFYIPQTQKNNTIKRCSAPPINGVLFRHYIDKNLIGSLSGSSNFNIYRTSGTVGGSYGSSSHTSTYYNNLSFTFNTTNLNPSNKDWSMLDNNSKQLAITLNNPSAWSSHSLSVSGSINASIGAIDFYLNQYQPFTGESIFLGVNPDPPYQNLYYQPSYWIDELSFVSNIYPYNYLSCIEDNFSVIDDSTLVFTESQLAFVSGSEMVLVPYPHSIKDMINFNESYNSRSLKLYTNDIINISGVQANITGIYFDSNNNEHYLLNYDFGSGNNLVNIYLANPVSGVGYTDHRSFISSTGTYSIITNQNNTYAKTTTQSYSLPTVPSGTGCYDPYCYVPTGNNFIFNLGGPYYDSNNYQNNFITNILNSFTIARTSILIENNNTNDIALSSLIIPSSIVAIDSGNTAYYKLLYSTSMDFKVNNINIFDTYIPLFYSGYNGIVSDIYQSYLLTSGNNTTLHIKQNINSGDRLSYKILSSTGSNHDTSISNTFRANGIEPSFGDISTKLVRLSNWLYTNHQLNGTVNLGNNQNLTFRGYATGIQLTTEGISNYVSNNHIAGEYTIATGYLVLIPDNLTSWTGAGLGSPIATCSINVLENNILCNYGDLLTSGIRSTNTSSYDRLLQTTLYENVNLFISSPNNTGISSVSLSVKKPYHTININLNKYDEILRLMNNEDAVNNLYNNFDISFNINNIESGIFHFNTLSNKLLSTYPYSRIYNISHGNTSSFSIAVESGYLPSNIQQTGFISLGHQRCYDLKQTNLLPLRAKKQQVIVNFIDNSILSDGIYDTEYLGNPATADVQSIYLYDFANSFSTNSAKSTGIIYYNHTAFNTTDSKFSIWGNNFNGDTIIYPFRDLVGSVQESSFSCATGYLCIKLSGNNIGNYLKANDKFWIDIDPQIYPQSSDYIVCTGSRESSPGYLVYVPDAINSGVKVGMNIFSPYITNGAYITEINYPYIKITGDQALAPFNFDYLSFNKETTSQQISTQNLRTVFRNYLRGPSTIYNIVKSNPNVVSILLPLPPFFNDPNNIYYNEWNTNRNTRGINVWRSSGSPVEAIMITGVENIQTDKNPNYNYQYLSVSPTLTISPSPTGYSTNGYATGIVNTTSNMNREIYTGFHNTINKYINGITFSGIYKPTYTSGTITSNASLPDSSDWTTSETKTIKTPLIIRDIDSFRILGADILQNNTKTSLTSSGNNFIIDSYLQDQYTTLKFAINGGASIGNIPPEIFISGINSNYNFNKYFIEGIPSPGSGITSYRYPIGPYSNTWFIDLNISGLNNIEKFAVKFKDPLGTETKTCEIYNNNQLSSSGYISNINNTIYYNTSLVAPWVISFDVENVGSGSVIGISGGSATDTNIISSGITYTNELNKWQGYILGHSTASNNTYTVSFGITGSIDPIIFNSGIKFTGINTIYGSRFSNYSSVVKFQNTGIDNIIGYFNYQKIQPYTIQDPILSASNNPSGTNVVFAKIDTEYDQVTSRNLYSFTINNIGPTGYNLAISALDDGQTSSFNNKILSYNQISISNISVLEPNKFIGEMWQLSFDINGGGGSEYEPDIQLFNVPSKYKIGKNYNTTLSNWRIQVSGDVDFLGKHNQITGIYNINIYARDLTGHVRSSATQNYLFPVNIKNIKPYHAVKNKDYFINLDLTNPISSFDSSYTIPLINTFLPSTQTKIYDQYNYLLNINELRYSGDKLTDKWNTRLNISNLNQEYNYLSTTKPNITIDVKGLDTDVISVIGMLKMKELDVISTDYPPLQIVSLLPVENQISELNQGENWSLSFGVVGGLSSPNFPPTILLSGLPSTCSGYYPDTDPAGPACLQTRTYSDVLQKWTFVFNGVSNCATGQFDVGVKAFDSTGEDTANTSYYYKPLSIPGPSINSQIDTSLYPNCQFTSGNIKYISSQRALPCPYATGISGINIIGNLPSGLYLVDRGGLTAPFNLGTGLITITGTPTAFPANNIYESFIVQVVDKAGKKASTVVTYNTAGISPMQRNPKAATLFFPNSGYYTSYVIENNIKKDQVADGTQITYDPYPTSKLFDCTSSLSNNNCAPQITGTYEQIYSSGITIFTKSTPIQQTNVYAILNDNITGLYNGIYSLINVESNTYEIDPITNIYIPQYSGLLINLANTGFISGITPVSGSFKYVTFSVAERNMLGSTLLFTNPTTTLGCKTCIMGDGYVNASNKLSGKMRPSMIASITGNYYPLQVYTNTNTYIDNGPENLIKISGVNINPIQNTGHIHELCFSNCYETGLVYLSGIIIPMPLLDITDPQTLTYNSQPVALATRCSFGTGSYRNSPTNYRTLSIQYYIKDLINNQYYNTDTSSFVSTPYVKSISTSTSPTNVSSISFSAPTMSTGTVLQLFMYRDSDQFPTFNINSYDYLEYSSYWIHKASNENDAVSSGTYPGFVPIGFGSGLTIITGTAFNLYGQIIGGNGTGSLTPSISGILTSSGSNIEILDSNSNSHNININLLSPAVRNGLWDVSLTGQIVGLTGSYLDNYDFIVGINENPSAPYHKNTTTRIPVTFLKPLELDIPVTDTQSETEIYVNYGTKWNLQFNIIGGNRPPRYWNSQNTWVNDNYPIIEIDNEICTFEKITFSYSIENNEWSVLLRSKNIITDSTNIVLNVRDKTGSVSHNFNVVVV